MAQPTAYTRQYNFNDFSTTSPSSPLPGVQIDNELNKVLTNLDGLNTNIALVQRDDGKLSNQSVHKNAFDNDALALIGVSGYTVSGTWAAATSYATATLVSINDATYLSTVAHTSGTVFSTDLAAGKWILLANSAINTSASAVDKFEGNGSTTAFTLSYSYSSVNDIQVFVNGAIRNPTDEYTVSGTTLTLSTPPSAPSVSGNENVIVWGANVALEASKQAAASSATTATSQATLATNAKTAAETAQGLSEAARDTSVTAKNDSVTAKTASETAQTASETAKTASETAQTASETAKTASESARDASITAKTASETAQTLSETAKTASETAKTASETAKTASESARDTATNYATETDSLVTGTSDDSSKSWAIGGSGSYSMRSSGKGSAKEWASYVAGTADGTEYSAKEYAIGDQRRGSSGGGSAKDWATYTGGTVDDALYSAKKYAEDAQTASASASGSLSTFQAIWQGSGASDPSGGTVSDGDLFYNTTSNQLKVYNSGWQAVALDASSFATPGQALAFAIAL